MPVEKKRIPSLVGSCISSIVARARICNPENEALGWILADLSPVVFLPVAVCKLDRIAFDLKTRPV